MGVIKCRYARPWAKLVYETFSCIVQRVVEDAPKSGKVEIQIPEIIHSQMMPTQRSGEHDDSDSYIFQHTTIVNLCTPLVLNLTSDVEKILSLPECSSVTRVLVITHKFSEHILVHLKEKIEALHLAVSYGSSPCNIDVTRGAAVYAKMHNKIEIRPKLLQGDKELLMQQIQRNQDLEQQLSKLKCNNQKLYHQTSLLSQKNKQLEQQSRHLTQANQELNEQVTELDQLRHINQQLNQHMLQLSKKNQQLSEQSRQLIQVKQELQLHLVELDQQSTQLREANQQLDQQLRQLLVENQELKHQQENQPSWIVQQNDLVLSSTKPLGRDFYGEVREAMFHGCKVAVKCIHEVILSEYNQHIFYREIMVLSSQPSTIYWSY